MATSDELAAAVEGQTIPGEFAKTAARRGDVTALRWRTPDGGWGEWSWREYADRAARVARGLTDLGVERGERVVLMLRNRPEFHVADPVDVEKADAAVQPGDLATVIYTSGTTGPPKGVMLSHFNVCWTTESTRRAIGFPVEGFRLVSYLPMAHVAERVVSHYFHALDGTEVTSCPDPAQLAAYLRQVRPNYFFAVPRGWEKLYAG